MNHGLLLLAVPLVAYRPPSFAAFSFYTPFLLVPLAALLGKRHGTSGVVAIAIGGLLCVVNINGPWGGVGGSPALYLIALAVAAMAAMPRPFVECLDWPQEDRSATWLSFAAPFLLIFFIGTGYAMTLDRHLRIAFDFGFSSLGYFLLFLLGARGIRVMPLGLGLVAAGAASWGWMISGFHMRGSEPVVISISPLHPSMVLAALAMAFSGAATRAFLGRGTLPGIWRRPYLTVTALMCLWFGLPLVTAIPVGIKPGAIYLLQVTAALPLASFMSGLLLGARGAVYATSLTTVLIVAANIAAISDSALARDLVSRRSALEAPFVAAAYAMVGMKVAEFRLKRSDFGFLRLPTILLLLFFLVIGITLEILGQGSPVRVALAVLFIVFAIAACVAAWRLRHAMRDQGLAVTSEKWVPFVAILGVIGAAIANMESVVGELKQLSALALMPAFLFGEPAGMDPPEPFREALDGGELAMLLMMAAVYSAVLIAVVRGLWRTVPKVYADLRQIAFSIRNSIGNRRRA